jgi:dGTPase
MTPTSIDPSFRLEHERREAETLSPHACPASRSRGRLRPEPDDPVRTCFQRDRDRVLHCKSFRRLAHKTQVFLSPAGDHYRTRITHTLEVSQIARTIARALRLNEDLTEAIALGHDLGHTPFGHTGEAVLARLLPGGFHHVHQSLRVVDLLEKDGAGLNLTHEVREGIERHSKGRGSILAAGTDSPSTLEAQVVRVADIIAYLNHDLDDAIRANILGVDDVPATVRRRVGRGHSEGITFMIGDVLAATDLERERRVLLTPGGEEVLATLREFLYERVYDNPTVHGDLAKAERVLEGLWQRFVDEDPDGFRSKHWPAGVGREEPIERAVADFIASMTDRYALRLFEDLLLPKRWPVF